MPAIKEYSLRLIGFFFMLASLTACASLDNTDDQASFDDARSPMADAQTLEFPFTEADENGGEAEACSIAEPEITVSLELEELEKLGEWEEGPLGQAGMLEAQYDFPVTVNKQVEFYLDFFQNKQRKTFARWLARSGRYLPLIKKHLQEAGLPLDLVYLPMIESGFSLTAYSRAKAVGPWQFMRATGRHYKLTVNKYVDERRDPVKSTKAAVAYLSKLYDDFGSWHLAVAGYNAGEGKINRAIKKYNTDNFWELARGRYLKPETKLYVPKLIAAIMIAKNPEKYGFGDVEYQSPLAYETLQAPRWTSLKALALAADVKYKTIRELNRELRCGTTPPYRASYPVKVPPGKKTLALKNLPRVRAVATTKYKRHVVRKKETLGRIARRYNLNKSTILKTNKLDSASLRTGQRLRIPYRTTTYKLVAKNASGSGAAVVSDSNLVLHTVKPGETVSHITKKYKVPFSLIASWNGIRNINRIKAGQQLALYLGDTTAYQDKRVAALEEDDGDNARPTYYRVRGGDTLWAIARRYKLTPEQIREWNGLKGNTIHPGRRLLLRLADADA